MLDEIGIKSSPEVRELWPMLLIQFLEDNMTWKESETIQNQMALNMVCPDVIATAPPVQIICKYLYSNCIYYVHLVIFIISI